LLTPWGNKPLFETDLQLEVDEQGYLGDDPVYLHSPPQIQVPHHGPQRTPENADEFFDDGDNVMGVFDNVLPDPDN
jgi:hypothetical protein